MFKLKSKLIVAVMVIFGITAFISCEKEQLNKNNEISNTIAPKEKSANTGTNIMYESNGVIVNYSGTLIGNNLHVKINFNNTINNSILDEVLNFNLRRPDYVNKIAKSIETKAVIISKHYSLQEIETFIQAMENMLIDSIYKMSIEDKKLFEIQGVFMCKSLLLSSKRVILSKLYPNDTSILLSNTPNNGFELELCVFQFNEDIIINKNLFLSFIKNDPKLAIDKGGYVFEDVLNSIDKPEMPLQTLLIGINEYIENNSTPDNPVTSWWPSGSDHGCCGNYSGPCYYWDPVCYIHDVLCTNCEPGWFCFSGCVPD